MKTRPKRSVDYYDPHDDDYSHESDEDYRPEKRKPRVETFSEEEEEELYTTSGRRNGRTSASRIEDIRIPNVARVYSLASDDVHPTTEDDEINTEKAETMSRIRKALNLANHKDTSEHEAKQALRLSQRLMSKFNIRQADLINSDESSKERAQRAGCSITRVKAEKTPSKGMQLQTWVSMLGSAIDTFFQVKHYTTHSHRYIDFNFYGLVENSSAAAMTFESSHNLIWTWRLSHREFSGIASKNDYCTGLVEELQAIAHRELRAEEQRADARERAELRRRQREENLQRASELSRLNPKIEEEISDDDDIVEEYIPPPKIIETIELSDDEEGPRLKTDFADDDEDSLEEIEEKLFGIKKEPEDKNISIKEEKRIKKSSEDLSKTKVKSENLKQENNENGKIEIENGFENTKLKTEVGGADTTVKIEDLEWNNSTQLIRFRENASKVADEWMEDQNVDLIVSRRTTIRAIRDRSAYQRGKSDAAKVPIGKKRIKDR